MALRNEAEHKIAVHCRGIIKIYGSGDTRVMALRGVDLEVYLGELLMLVGPSGSGKTTLISIIAGLLDPDGGACVVLDRDLRQMGAADRARFRGRSVGFVFQTFHLLPSITIAMNVAVPLLINGIPRKSADARALVHEPKLIVCNEPTSNLDHATGHKVMEILRRVAQSPDRALLVVTHDARILGFADRIARMDDGKVIEIRKEAAGSQ